MDIYRIKAEIAQLKDTVSKLKESNRNLKRRLRRVEELLFPSKKRLNIGIDVIITVVSRYYGMPKERIYSRDRHEGCVAARQMIMLYAYCLLRMSKNRIGMVINRHHTTVMHGLERLEGLLKYDEKTKRDVEKINNILAEVSGTDEESIMETINIRMNVEQNRKNEAYTA